jgi:transposase
MGGKSPIVASEDQRVALRCLAGSRERGEADRARAVLLTLSGWSSPQIAEAFGVREDTVRLWRSDFGRGGVDALKASVAPGPPPVKSTTALRVVTPLLEEPVADRPNWTIARLRAAIEAREGVRISRSQLSKVVRKKVPVAAPPAHAEGEAERRRGGADWLAAAPAQAPGRSRRHRSALRRRKRGPDTSLSRAPGRSPAPTCACQRRDKPRRWRCWARSIMSPAI